MPRDLVAALKVAIDALESAPHKTRLDFQPYWDWYDGNRERAIQQAMDALKPGPPEGVRKA